MKITLELSKECVAGFLAETHYTPKVKDPTKPDKLIDNPKTEMEHICERCCDWVALTAVAGAARSRRAIEEAQVEAELALIRPKAKWGAD